MRILIFLLCVGGYMLLRPSSGTRQTRVSPSASKTAQKVLPPPTPCAADLAPVSIKSIIAVPLHRSTLRLTRVWLRQAPDGSTYLAGHAWGGEKLPTCKCVFPFAHEETAWGKTNHYTVRHCTEHGHNELWCATSVDKKTNAKKDWGDCAEVCPVNCAIHGDCDENYHCDPNAQLKTCIHCRHCGGANACTARCKPYEDQQKKEKEEYEAAQKVREAEYQRDLKRKAAQEALDEQRRKDIAKMNADKAKKKILAQKKEELKHGGLYGGLVQPPSVSKQNFDTSKMR